MYFTVDGEPCQQPDAISNICSRARQTFAPGPWWSLGRMSLFQLGSHPPTVFFVRRRCAQPWPLHRCQRPAVRQDPSCPTHPWSLDQTRHYLALRRNPVLRARRARSVLRARRVSSVLSAHPATWVHLAHQVSFARQARPSTWGHRAHRSRLVRPVGRQVQSQIHPRADHPVLAQPAPQGAEDLSPGCHLACRRVWVHQTRILVADQDCAEAIPPARGLLVDL